MNVERMTARGRKLAESIMTDTVRIYRHTGEVSTDPETGEVLRPTEELYTGKCRIRPLSTMAAESPTGGVMATQLPMILSLPITEVKFTFDEMAEMLTSLDPGLVGTVLRVRSEAVGSQLSARRLTCEIASE